MQQGIREYFDVVHGFSRNAKLYVVHFMMMAFRIGAWQVAFNLYLLGLGFDAAFIGFRIAADWIIVGLLAVFAGRFCDRVGRRKSFIWGDALGAFASFALVFGAVAGTGEGGMPINGPLIIFFSLVEGVFRSVHMVAEMPWITENTSSRDRLHLFAIDQAMGRLTWMVASLVAYIVPVALVGATPHVHDVPPWVFQIVLLASSTIWLASVIPAVMLRENVEVMAELRREARGFSFRNIVNRGFVARFVPVYLLYWLGLGLVHPLHNVFFTVYVGAAVDEVALIMLVGTLSMALGSFLIPVFAKRFGKVPSVTWSLYSSIPFTLGIVAFPSVFVSGLFFIFHELTIHISEPIFRAYAMENVVTRERATVSGLMVSSHTIALGVGSWLGGWFMATANWVPLNVLVAGLFLGAAFSFNLMFRRREAEAMVPAPA